jgi:antitoxin component of MazEF toxin-antitoxin module
MIKTVTKIGNSQGVIFDAALMDLAHLKVGDELAVTMHEGGTITLTPMRPQVPREDVSEAIRKTMQDYASTMKKLA